MDDIYRYPARYDAIVGGSDGAAPWVRLATDIGGPVLELASGTGCIIGPISKVGLDCTALDLSPQMSAFTAANYPSVGTVTEDMRQFSLGRKFQFIYIANNSLLHLTSEEDRQSVFDRVREHLLPGGQFIFSIYTPNLDILARPSDKRFPAFSYSDPETSENVSVEETTDFDAASGISTITWFHSRGTESDFLVHPLVLQNLFPDEADAMVAASGLQLLDKSGDLSGTPYEPTCREQIFQLATVD